MDVDARVRVFAKTWWRERLGGEKDLAARKTWRRERLGGEKDLAARKRTYRGDLQFVRVSSGRK
jgi:hypothetical protein